MTRRRATLVGTGTIVLLCAVAGALLTPGFSRAQAPQPQKSAVPTPASASAPRAVADLNQLMRGILFNNANVIFFAQNNDPAAVKRSAQPSGATDPLAGVYGGWTAIEYSALALSEAANLLNLPGRVCSNGKPVPVNDAEWQKYVEGLRAVGQITYQAAQTKDMDKMLDASDQVGTACLNCHDRYRRADARCQ